VTALSVLKLIAMPPGRISGQILWLGRDLVPLSAEAMNRIRAREIAIVFQEPMTSLNPVYTIGDQIGEVIALHEGLGRRAVLERTIDMLALVQIPNPRRRVNDYPHQFSGGMRQRVMIAMALSCHPKGLIRSIPRVDKAAGGKIRLQTIAGTVPKLIAPPPGCRFAPRCSFATDECKAAQPALRELEPGHKVACIHAEQTGAP